MSIDPSGEHPRPQSPSMPTETKINLMRGWPSPSLLPTDLLRAAANRVLSDPAVSTPALEYGPDSGYEPLRQSLAKWLGSHYGVTPDPERICITGGASQNIACVLQSFTDPRYTQAVWIAAPCYYLACPIFDDAGFRGRLRAINEDDEGIDIDSLRNGMIAVERKERSLKTECFMAPEQSRKLYKHIIYVVSTCANPSGTTTSLRRRTALVELARKHNALIISDDVYDFLQWPLGSDATSDKLPELHLPRLCDIDRGLGPSADDPNGFGHAISNGSFSKIAGPGLRTGWVEATQAFAYGLSQTGSTRSGGAPSQLCAAILNEVVQNGDLKIFTEAVTIPTLQRRHEVMMQSLRKHVVPLGVQVRDSSLAGAKVYGGYFVWCILNEGQSANEIAKKALDERDVIVGSGTMFEVYGDEDSARFSRYIRLCYAWESEKRIADGVQRLGEVLAKS